MTIKNQEKPLYPEIIYQLPYNIYKRKRGKILVIGGSITMVGAPTLVCEAAYRSGVGIVVLGYPDIAKDIFKHLIPETMSLPLPSNKSGSISLKALDILENQIKDFDVVIIGPGLSRNSETQEFIWRFIFNFDIPMVIDADAIHALSLGLSIIKEKIGSKNIDYFLPSKSQKLIITPHPGEAVSLIKSLRGRGELLNINSSLVDKEKEKFAPWLARKIKSVVVLKGFNTTIANWEGETVINKTGGPALATAGTGDVLAGIIGALYSQNLQKPFEVSCMAVYLHGLAGDLAAQDIGSRSIIASDVIKYLPRAIKKVEINFWGEKNE